MPDCVECLRYIQESNVSLLFLVSQALNSFLQHKRGVKTAVSGPKPTLQGIN